MLFNNVALCWWFVNVQQRPLLVQRDKSWLNPPCGSACTGSEGKMAAGPGAASTGHSGGRGSSGALESSLDRRFQGVTNTMESIQGLSSWCIENKKHHSLVVRCWMKWLKRCELLMLLINAHKHNTNGIWMQTLSRCQCILCFDAQRLRNVSLMWTRWCVSRARWDECWFYTKAQCRVALQAWAFETESWTHFSRFKETLEALCMNICGANSIE